MAKNYKVGEAPWEINPEPPQQTPPQSFPVGGAPWETGSKIPDIPQEKYSSGASALEGLGQGASFGYIPEGQAALESGLNAVLPESMGGGDTSSFKERLDRWRARDKGMQAEDPWSYGAGTVGGAIAIPLPGGVAAKGAGAMSRIARGVAQGAAVGAITNPGEQADQVGQLRARLEQAKTGGIIGGAFPTAFAAAGALGRGLKTAGKKLTAGMTGIPQKAIETYADRGAEVDNLIAENKIPDLADQIHGELVGQVDTAKQAARQGLVQPGADVSQDLPSRINSIQSKIDNTKNTLKEGLANLRAGINPAKIEAAQTARKNITAKLQNQLGADDIDTAMAQKLQAEHQQLKDAFFQRKSQLGQMLSDKITSAKIPVDARKAITPFVDVINKLRSSELSKTPQGKAEIDALMEMTQGMFKGLSRDMTGKGAWELQDVLRHNANLQNVKGTFQNRFGPNSTRVEKLWSNANKAAYDAMNSELQRVAGAAGLKKSYAQTMRLQDVLDKHFETPEKMYSTLSNMDKPNKVFVKQLISGTKNLANSAGVDLEGTAGMIEQHARTKLPDEKILPKQLSTLIEERSNKAKVGIQDTINKLNESFGNPDQTLRTLETLGTEKNLKAGKNAELAKMLSQQAIDPATEARSIQSLRKLQRFDAATTPKQLEEFATTPGADKYIGLKNLQEKYFKDPERTFKTMSGMDAPSRQYQKKVIEGLEEKTGVPIKANADLLEASRYFAKPGLVPYSGGAATSTSRTLTGTAIGGALGSAIGGPLGGAVGSGAGLAATSPLAVKKVMQTYRRLVASGQTEKAQALLETIQAQAPKGVAPWILLKQGQK